MNQVKIGKFIAECRKNKNLTQEALAEKLGITDRSVSKWERGLNLPDASLMIELCEILDITVNELLTGEIIKKGEYMEKSEEKLIELKKNEEIANKKILNLEWVIGAISSISFIILIFIASYLEMSNIVRVILIVMAIVIFFIGVVSCLKIEREVGYYECSKCHHKYIPTNLQMWLAMHIIRTRYLKCPHCKERSWSKKVLTK